MCEWVDRPGRWNEKRCKKIKHIPQTSTANLIQYKIYNLTIRRIRCICFQYHSATSPVVFSFLDLFRRFVPDKHPMLPRCFRSAHSPAVCIRASSRGVNPQVNMERTYHTWKRLESCTAQALTGGFSPNATVQRPCVWRKWNKFVHSYESCTVTARFHRQRSTGGRSASRQREIWWKIYEPR